MQFARSIFALLLGAALAGSTLAQSSLSGVSVVSEADAVEITVPQSTVVLRIASPGLTRALNNRGGATASPRYFYLVNSTAGTVVSGWFESSGRAVDLRATWESEMRGLQANGFGPPTEVAEESCAGMQCIFYNLPLPTGSSSHVRASIVQAGTWLDLHLSVTTTSSETESRKQLNELMQKVHVEAKR